MPRTFLLLCFAWNLLKLVSRVNEAGGRMIPNEMANSTDSDSPVEDGIYIDIKYGKISSVAIPLLPKEKARWQEDHSRALIAFDPLYVVIGGIRSWNKHIF